VKHTLILFVMAAAAASGIRASAHHRFAETYVEDREITIEGELAEWHYREPHSFLRVVARNGRNAPETWIVECRGASQLRRLGMTPDTLRLGQHVVITGSPGRVSTEQRRRLRAIVRPHDGWRWRDAVK
jgi:hypothetical protein